MNTNRDASAHTRKIAARTVTMYHVSNPVRKGLNTDTTASVITKIQQGPADEFLKPIYERTILGLIPSAPSTPAADPAPPAPIGPSGATPVQLLVNSGFTNGTTGWSSSTGFATYNYSSGSQPAVVSSINDNGIIGSDGYLILSYASATISQTVSISNIADYNIITGVLNITRIPNNAGRGADAFSFQVDYKNASNVTVATTRTPASGTQAAPETFTDYTLTFTRDDSVAFDTIVSATVSFSGIDTGFWAGQHGPAIDYCTLTLT